MTWILLQFISPVLIILVPYSIYKQQSAIMENFNLRIAWSSSYRKLFMLVTLLLLLIFHFICLNGQCSIAGLIPSSLLVLGLFSYKFSHWILHQLHKPKLMFLAFVATLVLLFVPGMYSSAVTLGIILVASLFYPTKERIRKITGSDSFIHMMTNTNIVKEKSLPQYSDCMEKMNDVDVASKPQINSKTESHTTTNN